MKYSLTLLLILGMGIVFPILAQESKEQKLEVFFSSLSKAAESGDKTAYTELFLPNAGMFLPHRPPLLGRDQIGDWFDTFVTSVELVLDSYKQEQIDIVGDVAVVRSTAIGYYLVKATEEQVPFDQKYLDILQYDGNSWRMSYHVANSSTLKPGIWDRNW